MGKIFCGLAALLALTGATENKERIVDVPGIVEGRIAEASGRFRIDPAATAMPLISTELATRAKLKASFFGIAYLVGPERVRGRTDVSTIDLGEGPIKRRIAWTEQPYAAGVDGVIGPGGLPDPIVRFILRPSLPGERTVELPMIGQGGMADRWAELFARVDVEGVPVRVSFDPYHPDTLATASAAVRIARAHEGVMTDEGGTAEIAFGIARPIRAMTLARPLAIGPLSINRLGVRTSDFGSSASIREKDQDPNEIIVTGGKKPDPDRDRLSIGADILASCSSITFDKPAEVIRLTCA